MTHPGRVDPFPCQYANEHLRIGVRQVAKRIRANKGIDVDHRWPRTASGAERCALRGWWRVSVGELLSTRGKDPGGKIREALRHRMSARSPSDNPITSSARSFARPVSIVRSHAQSRRW